MGKIRNSLVGLVVGAGLVFGAGAVDVARGDDLQGFLKWRGYNIGKQMWEDNRQLQLEDEQQKQIEYNQNQQQNNQGALEDGVGNGLGVKEFFAFTKEGWNDKNNDGRVSGEEIDEIYKKGFNPDDHLIFDIHFKNGNTYSTASFKIINTDTGKIDHNEFNKNIKFAKDLFYPNRNGIKLDSGNYIAIFEEQGLNPIVYKFSVKE